MRTCPTEPGVRFNQSSLRELSSNQQAAASTGHAAEDRGLTAKLQLLRLLKGCGRTRFRRELANTQEMEDRIDRPIRSALVWGTRVSLWTQDIGTCPLRSGDYLLSCCGGFEPGDAQHVGAARGAAGRGRAESRPLSR